VAYTRNEKIAVSVFKNIPKSLISRFFGIIARIPFPRAFIARVIGWYVRKYDVNTAEYAVPEGGFPTFDAFFTRPLKPEILTVDRTINAVVSPVDARIDQFGKINNVKMIQAKGIHYSLFDLIPSQTAQRFINGSFITLYLSPGDYHRIHSPANGVITGYFNIPGKLFPVYEFMVRNVKGLFSINERVISYIETKAGWFAVCKIGAMNVGRITLAYAHPDENRAACKRKEVIYKVGDRPKISAGEELGIFHLGSTIVMLFEKDAVRFVDMAIGQKLRVGNKMALMIKT
jgi:phosphatidylserine decarboxylase